MSIVICEMYIIFVKLSNRALVKLKTLLKQCQQSE